MLARMGSGQPLLWPTSSQVHPDFIPSYFIPDFIPFIPNLQKSRFSSMFASSLPDEPISELTSSR